MSFKHVFAATFAIAAAALAISSANAMTGGAAINRCIDIGVEGGCIFSCNQSTGACKIDMLDTGQTIICPSRAGECHMGRRTPKPSLTGTGSKSTLGVTAQ